MEQFPDDESAFHPDSPVPTPKSSPERPSTPKPVRPGLEPPTPARGNTPVTGYYVVSHHEYEPEITLNRDDEKEPEYGIRHSLSRSVSPRRSPSPPPRSPTDESNAKIAYAVGVAFMLATVAAVMSE